MKYLLLLVFVIPFVSATLNCTISNSSCSNLDVFHLSNLTNAHIELSNESNYNYSVCCSETTGQNLSIGCGTGLINLSANTNAHAEQSNETNYNVSVCLNTNNGSISCNYRNSTCPEACLGTISTNITNSYTNLHVSDCDTDPYLTRLCCSYTPPSPTVINLGQTGIISAPAPYQKPELNITDIVKSDKKSRMKLAVSGIIFIGSLFLLIIMLYSFTRKPKSKHIKGETQP